MHEHDREVQSPLQGAEVGQQLGYFGGVVFIVGSVLFFPRFEAYADIGAWTFFFGSLLYLVVTGHDMAEAVRYRRGLARRSLASDLEFMAAAAYFVGTILFAVGSIYESHSSIIRRRFRVIYRCLCALSLVGSP